MSIEGKTAQPKPGDTAPAPKAEPTAADKMRSDIPASAGGASPLSAMRAAAKEQAIKAVALVKEAENTAKANGEEIDLVLERMIMARLEAKSAATVQAKVAYTAYMDAYERIILVGNGIHKAQGIKIEQIVERLSILADGLKGSGEAMMEKARKA